MSILVIVPCGRSKVWDRTPGIGPVQAREAYRGTPFVVNRMYAECFGDAWVILSAKYGLVPPEDQISGPYDVTFNRQSTNPVKVETLRRQIHELGLDRFSMIIALGGRRYRDVVRESFCGLSARLEYPFAGLSLGKMVQATKLAVIAGDPCIGRIRLLISEGS